MRVTVAKSGRDFGIEPRQSLLDAALAAGLNLPHSCKSGSCGICLARLLAGEVRYPFGRPLGLTEAQIGDGLVLMCQARADGDLEIEIVEPVAAGNLLVKRLPGRIERIELCAHDVAAVHLRLPPAEPLEFRPGQYLDVILPKGRRRSFSIASPPHDARLLELHVRHAPGGEFTDRLFAGGAVGTLLDIEGPLGHFIYSDPAAAPGDAAATGPAGRAAPLLLVGGGTGLAPLKSILRHITERGPARQLALYWGVRTERDLYANDWLEARAREAAGFHYVPVLSEPSSRWRGRRGWVHQAVLDDLGDLERHEVYACGPPAMIEALRRDFIARGLDPARLKFDSFDYAPDTLERQRTSSDTRS